MSKYSVEFKNEVIKYCIEKGYSYERAAREFNIPSSETVRRWCKRYEIHGLNAILKLKNNFFIF